MGLVFGTDEKSYYKGTDPEKTLKHYQRRKVSKAKKTVKPITPQERFEQFKERVREQPVEEPYDYLIEHSKGKARQRLIQAGRVPGAKGKYAASIIASRLAHSRLTPEQKAEFGFRYTRWEEIPATERKHYYGGKEHLESLSLTEKEQVIERFKKEEPTSAYFYKEFYGGLYGKSDEFIQNQMWKGLTLTEEEQQKSFWEGMPSFLRWQVSGVHAFGSAVLWPVILPQAGVKLAIGGKTLILPDVGKEISKYKPGAMPSGLISTGVSEGIGALTGKGSDAWSKFQADPFSGIFATVGEWYGLKVGSIPVSTGIRIARIGLKYGKKGTLSYIKGEKILVKEYPLVKGYPKTFREGDTFARIWKFKGFGKTKLVHPSQAASLKPFRGGYARLTGDPSFDFKLIYEGIKVKGLFRKTITQRYASTGVSIFEKGYTVPYTVKGGLQIPYIAVKKTPKILKGLWKDSNAYGSLVTTVKARPMVSSYRHAGYLAKEVVKISAKDVSMGSLSSLGYGLGYLSASALSNELRNADRTLSVSKSAFKTIQAYDVMPSMASLSLQESIQMQKMKTVSMLKPISLSQTKTSLSKPSRGGRTSFDYPSFMPKIALLPFKDPFKRKKKTPFDVASFEISFHKREHKIIKLEDLIKGNSIKIKGLKL